MSSRILIVEDESSIREMLVFIVEQQGYLAMEAADYASAEASLLAEPYPDLILLDWMLPGGSGLQLAQWIKKTEHLKQIPLIMLTARSEEEDKIKGLDVGADDYVTKPFSPKELIARIRAVLRRVAPTALNEPVQIEGLCLDPSSHRVMANQEPLDMGPTEFRLLHFFMTHPDRVYSREQLLDQVWGTNVYVVDRTVDVHILRLRKALEKHHYDRFIQTVRGVGYRFSAR